VKLKKVLLWMVLFLAAISTAGPVAYYTVARMNLFNLTKLQNLLLPERNKLQLSRLGQVQMLNLDRWENRREIRVLTLRQAEFAFYSRVRFITHIDPRMVPFYLAPDVDTAFRELRRLGITHVSIPEEPLPTLYNSFLVEITNSGRFVRRRDHFGATTLCELYAEPTAVSTPGDEQVSAGHDWTLWTADKEYGRKDVAFTAGPTSSTVLNEPAISAAAKEVRLSSGPGPIDVAPDLAGIQDAFRLAVGKEYRLEADVKGEGLVQAEAHIYIDDSPPQAIPVWQGYISGRTKSLQATFTQDVISPKCTDCPSATARIVLRLLSRGRLEAGETRIRESGLAGSSSSMEVVQARWRGWSLQAIETTAIKWGWRNGHPGRLFLKHAGAYPVEMESAAFTVPRDAGASAVEFEVRGEGRFFTELRCATDSRSSAQELSPDTTWLGRVLTTDSNEVQHQVAASGIPVQRTVLAFASREWRKMSVRLQPPDCPPLASGALISRMAPQRESGAPGDFSGKPTTTLIRTGDHFRVMRLAVMTRWERDFRGKAGEMPEVEFRNIILEPGGGQSGPDSVRL